MNHQPLAGEEQEAETLEKVTQEAILLQAYQAGYRRSTETTPESDGSIDRAANTGGAKYRRSKV